MPQTNAEAAAELRELLKERPLTAKSVAAELGKTDAWISRRLSGDVPMRLDDYVLLKQTIVAVAPREALFH